LTTNYQFILKRAFDVAAAGLLLLILVPALVPIALGIWLDSPGWFLFPLRVAGCSGKAFDEWKFRTMQVGAREKGHSFETSVWDPRITRVGRFLRRWSLDELPQLWNVLRGEMSLVGPRPAFVEVARHYSPFEARRLLMRPGLTGLAQIHGRNLLPWPERVAYDVAYIENYSLSMDFRILIQTIPVVLRGEGVYGPDGGVKMHDLAGSLEICDVTKDE
jgi:lipopolysaccharide/colanic/teichoic acid biosynthesis glycosyltransferase